MGRAGLCLSILLGVVFPHDTDHTAIVRDGLKYIQYHGVWDIEELYDLKADPLELTNLINHPDYYHQRQALRKALYAQAQGPSGQNAFPTRRDWRRG